MKSKFMLLLMAIVFSSYTFSQNQNISRKAASDYSTEVSNILMNKDKYLSSKDVTVENNFATFTKDSSPFTGKYVEFQSNLPNEFLNIIDKLEKKENASQ